MTEKRFTYILFDGFEDNGEYITPHKVAELLNELYKENQALKKHIRELYKYIKIDVDNEIEVYPKVMLEYLINILRIIGDVE